MSGLSWCWMALVGQGVCIEAAQKHASGFFAAVCAGTQSGRAYLGEVREKSFGNLAFNTLDALERHLAAALRTLEQDHPRVRSIVAWPWIINSLLN